MGYVNPNRLGVVLAVIMAAWHGVWTLLVATGVAQPIVDFVLRMHFMKPDVVVQPFEPVAAAGLLAAAAGLGYVAGAAMAMLWNCLSGCYRHEKVASPTLKQSAFK